jgi:holo-[acyl-carrier protein] synthase|tara:strand:- start:478 stop:858 length:381 start_codon:yes stop_codon:yes gene_type:complete
MILGIGTDIVDVARVKSIYEKYGVRFLDKILTPDEKEYCLSHENPSQYIAARFAAKEATAKCFGHGIGAKMEWKHIELRRRESGQPYIQFSKHALETFCNLECDVYVSVSHTRDYATATTIVESWE